MTWPFGMLQRQKYSVIYADPPWQFEGYIKSGVPQRQSEQHYATMNAARLAKLPVWQLAAPDCALLMWGIASHLPQVLKLGEAWGFEFKTKAFSWAKLNKHALRNFDAEPVYPHCNSNWFMGMGYTTRRNTEDCWLFTRGKPKVLDHGVRELIVAPIREHSRKPDEAIERIERLYAGPYCELFGRQERAGWSSWGDQVTKFG